MGPKRSLSPKAPTARGGSSSSKEFPNVFSEFLHYVKEGNLKQIRALLAQGKVDINGKDADGNCALHLSCAEGDLPMIIMLVDNGGSLTEVDGRGYTPILRAVVKGELSVVTWLVEKEGATMDSRSQHEGFTMFHLAAIYGHLPVVQWLVKEQDVNQDALLDNDGCTPVFYAAKYQHPIVLKYLVEHHAATNVYNHSGDTPLLCAAYKEALEECTVLAEHGADFSLKNRQGLTTLGVMNPSLRARFLMQHDFSEAALSAASFGLWFELLKVDDVPGLEVKVLAYAKKFPTLARATDRDGHEGFRVASKKGNKAALMSVLFALGRYELDRGPPLYRGAHTVVVAAVDHLAGDVSYEHGFRRALAMQDANDERWAADGIALNRFNERCLSPKAFCWVLRLLGVAADDSDARLTADFDQLPKDEDGRMTAPEFVGYCVARAGESRRVAIKFMRHRAQQEAERAARDAHGCFAPYHVLGLLDSPSDDDFARAAAALNVDGRSLADFPHALVMPCGDRSLDAVVRLERPDVHSARALAGHAARALQGMHSMGIVHGDFKLANVLRMVESSSSSSSSGGGGGASCTVLIDLVGVTKLDEPLGSGGGVGAGGRTSAGLLPPEMFAPIRDEEGRAAYAAHWGHLRETAPANDAERLRAGELWGRLQPWKAPHRTATKSTLSYVARTFAPGSKDPLPYKLVNARPTHDVWAFGLAVFAMVTGTPLFRGTGLDDGIDDPDLAAHLATLTDDDVDAEVTRRVAGALAADLLRKALRVAPKDRFQSFDAVLDHPFFDGWRTPPAVAAAETDAGREAAVRERAKQVAAIHAEEARLGERWRAALAEAAADEARHIAVDRRTVTLDALDAATVSRWRRAGIYLTPERPRALNRRRTVSQVKPPPAAAAAGTTSVDEGGAAAIVKKAAAAAASAAAGNYPLVVPSSFVLLPYLLDGKGVMKAKGGHGGAPSDADDAGGDGGDGGALYTGGEDDPEKNVVWLDKLAALSVEVSAAAAGTGTADLGADALETLLADHKNLHLYLLDEHTFEPCAADASGKAWKYAALPLADPAACAFVLRVLPHMLLVLKGVFLQRGPSGLAAALGFSAEGAAADGGDYLLQRGKALAGRLDTVACEAAQDTLTRAADAYFEAHKAAAAAKEKRDTKKNGGGGGGNAAEDAAVVARRLRGGGVLRALHWFFDTHDAAYELRGLKRVVLGASFPVHPGRAYWVSEASVAQLSTTAAAEETAFVQALPALWLPQVGAETEEERLRHEVESLRKQLDDALNPPETEEAIAIRSKRKTNVFMRVRRLMSKVVPGVEDPGDPQVLADLQSAANTVMPDFLKSTLRISDYGRHRKAIHAATSAAATVASGFSNHIIEELKNEKEAWLLSKELERHEMTKHMQEHIKMIMDDKDRWLDTKEREKQAIVEQMQAHLRQVIEDRDAMLHAKDKEIQTLTVSMEQHMQTMAADRLTIVEQKDSERASMIQQLENQIVRERETHHAREMQMDRENFLLHQQIDFLQLIVADREADMARRQGLPGGGIGPGIGPESADSFSSYLRRAYGTKKKGRSRGRSRQRSRPASPSDSLLVENESYSMMRGSVSPPAGFESSDDERTERNERGELVRRAYTGLPMIVDGSSASGPTSAAVIAATGVNADDEQLQQHLIAAFKRSDQRRGNKTAMKSRPKTAY